MKRTRQIINKKIEVSNNTINQLDLTGIYRTFYPTTGECTFFSHVHSTLSRVGHMLGHKTIFNKVEKVK